MPRLSERSSADVQAALGRGELLLRTGPFDFRLRTREPSVLRSLRALYGDFDTQDARTAVADFHLRVDRVAGPRRWVRPQVNCWLDGFEPFKPLPADHAFAMLEWTMNWCIASHAHHYLMLHAACLAHDDGRCVVLPGDPGAGKSTLTAALMLSGWRLLTDELTLIDRVNGDIIGLGRPVNLKNESIALIQAFAPEAEWGELAHDTHKGTVRHLRPSRKSVELALHPVRATHLVLPRWRAGAALRFSPVEKAEAFERVAGHGFNYSLLGRIGFDRLAALVDAAQCLSFEYASLDEAIAAFEGLS
ncbi:MAG: HprK-related kinase A [Burkholderiales bacterium]|nr:HprK-related kinase A [Burkholderiales bacterium]